jgi:hypothetical protein
MARIGFDIHDVFMDSAEALRRVLSFVCKKELAPAEVNKEYLLTRGFITSELFDECVRTVYEFDSGVTPDQYDLEALRTIRPVKGAEEVSRRLLDQKHLLFGVTASDLPAYTKIRWWINYNSFMPGIGVASCKRSGTKEQIVLEELKLDVFIDNKLKMLKPIAKMRREKNLRIDLYLLSRPNNLHQHPEQYGITRVPDLFEFERIINKTHFAETSTGRSDAMAEVIPLVATPAPALAKTSLRA